MILRFTNCARIWQFIAAVVIACGAGQVSADEPIRLRFLSYNIHHAEGVDRKLDVERIAEIIRSVKPDLVALQEVDRNTKRTKNVDQPAELARLTNMKVAFGPNISFQGGDYGNAVLSKFDIVQQKNLLLPNADNGEQRGVLSVEVRVPKLTQPLVLLATHLDHRSADAQRVQSVGVINALVNNASTDRPNQLTLLAGDMNDTIGSPTLRALDTAWTRVNSVEMPTVPVSQPKQQIDFLMYDSKSNWKVQQVKILDEAVASDHRAIFAVLEFVPSAND